MLNRTFKLVFVAVLLALMLSLTVSAQPFTPDEDTLVVAQSTDVQSLDPPQAGSRPEANIIAHLFGNLYDIQIDGSLTPELAESYTVSEDGTEYTFQLREGLTCHDGEALTAEDVVYTFQRAADPENAFTGNTPGFVFASWNGFPSTIDIELRRRPVPSRRAGVGS